jgi:gamma-glutamyltranspeptidase/glutathione hydrolase
MVLLGVLGYADGLDAAQVAALPRYHHQWEPDVIAVERDALPAATIAQLRAMGHTVQVPGEEGGGRRSSDSWGNLNTVEWDRRAGVLRAASDPRNPVGRGAVLLEATRVH